MNQMDQRIAVEGNGKLKLNTVPVAVKVTADAA